MPSGCTTRTPGEMVTSDAALTDQVRCTVCPAGTEVACGRNVLTFGMETVVEDSWVTETGVLICCSSGVGVVLGGSVDCVEEAVETFGLGRRAIQPPISNNSKSAPPPIDTPSGVSRNGGADCCGGTGTAGGTKPG